MSRIVETLERHGVDYLIVGGVAAGAYGATRPTGDVDVLADIPDRHGRRLRYEDLIGAATTIEQRGLVLRLAALAEIIASKEWADRPKDHQALPELRRLAGGADQPHPPPPGQ